MKTIKRKEIWPDYESQNDRIATIAIIISLILALAIVLAVLFQQVIYLKKVVEMIEADTYAAEIIPEPIQADVKAGRKIKELPAEVTPTVAILQTGEELPDPAIADGSFKTYLRHNRIKRKDSPQYQLQQLARTDEQGFRRYQQYYLIALGTAYTQTIGETFEIELSSGKVIDCMIGDVKADEHTDPSNRYIPINGNIVEFIIDEKVMDPVILKNGDISPLGFEGSIVRITRTDFEDQTGFEDQIDFEEWR